MSGMLAVTARRTLYGSGDVFRRMNDGVLCLIRSYQMMDGVPARLVL